MTQYHLTLAVLVLGACGCSGGKSAEKAPMILATTTSVRDTGLLDAILPPFEREHDVEVKVIAVGSGQALEYGRRGDADALLTHAPKLEEQFVADGLGVGRRQFMRNDFVIIGPKDDPAGIKGGSDGAAALAMIAAKEAPFVSRGDQSGTHVVEQSLWERAGAAPAPPWYIEAGTGMAATLRIAREKQAYTLTDRGTYLTLRDELAMPILVEGDPALENVYSIMAVNSAKHPHVNAKAAKAFVEYLTSPATKDAVAAFGRERFGEPIFIPLRPLGDQAPQGVPQ